MSWWHRAIISKPLPESIAQYVPHPMACLGTDGFGRSDGRGALRDFFEVDARYVAPRCTHRIGENREVRSGTWCRAR